MAGCCNMNNCSTGLWIARILFSLAVFYFLDQGKVLYAEIIGTALFFSFIAIEEVSDDSNTDVE